MTTLATITQWSYSTWQTHNQCPRKAYYKKILKLKEPETPRMRRGTRHHTIAENFVNGTTEALFDQYGNDISIFRRQFEVLRARNASCELEWAFTNLWHPTDFKAENAWCRAKTDATFWRSDGALGIVDYKTGKIYDDHKIQLQLYALGGFIMEPKAKVIVAQDWYLDQDAMKEETFARAQMHELLAQWNKRVQPMLTDTIFPMKPGPFCKGCHFRKENGGPCDF